jgi:hypothetical protein
MSGKSFRRRGGRKSVKGRRLSAKRRRTSAKGGGAFAGRADSPQPLDPAKRFDFGARESFWAAIGTPHKLYPQHLEALYEHFQDKGAVNEYGDGPTTKAVITKLAFARRAANLEDFEFLYKKSPDGRHVREPPRNIKNDYSRFCTAAGRGLDGLTITELLKRARASGISEDSISTAGGPEVAKLDSLMEQIASATKSEKREATAEENESLVDGEEMKTHLISLLVGAGEVAGGGARRRRGGRKSAKRGRTLMQGAGPWELPEGWEQMTSRSSGETYWFNTFTGDSTYERPNRPAADDQADDDDDDDDGATSSELKLLALWNKFGGVNPADANNAVGDLGLPRAPLSEEDFKTLYNSERRNQLDNGHNKHVMKLGQRTKHVGGRHRRGGRKSAKRRRTSAKRGGARRRATRRR